MVARDAAVLIKLGDSMRNSAMGVRITLPNIGALGKSVGPGGIPPCAQWEHFHVLAALIGSFGCGRNPALNPRVKLPNSAGLNRTVGFRVDFRLGFMGNYPNCGGINQIRGFRE